MPSYELSLLLRSMTKPELVATLKRTAEGIIDRGGVLTKFHSLGESALPYRITAHNQPHKKGSYFLMQFRAPPSLIEDLKDSLVRDVDIVRPFIIKTQDKPKHECTLEEELQPPAYREDVKKLIEEGRTERKPLYRHRMQGIDYYPFQR
nr:EOG090X0IQO [Eulimnadia texana]